MELKWTSKALSDLARLFEFLALANRTAAANSVKALVAAPKALLDNPRLGERLDEFLPQEVRRILVDRYEIRYQVQPAAIYVLRIWHTREER
ncbi:type II toxin-antitoxin system RelE/ParE family toxin [Serratia sp. TMDUHS_CL]|uniref:type II toxin-antitoxin system RelE/ParE family toxin n=1 Tax=Serratia sp. TMDUHS_CL TaxID=3128862 RepID=UPI00301A1BBA